MTTRKTPLQGQARQGDVLVDPVAAMPQSQCAAREEGRVVLAHGEVTGHSHAIVNPAAVLFVTSPVSNTGEPRRFLRATRPVVLRHEEHGPITIAKGDFEVVIQEEYDEGAVRQVVD